MQNQAQELTGGWFDGLTHVFPLRVYYEDTDFSGLVYHASYLRFMERGRSEFLRASGAGHQTLFVAADPLVWVVRRMTIDFAKAARIEDALTVRTTVLDLAGARMKLDQAVMRMDDLLVRADVEVCTIGLQGRPRRLPGALRKQLEFYLKT